MSKALVIETHYGLKSTLSKLLKGMGIEPIEASSINEIYRHDIDLIITNSSINKEIVETNIPIIVLTPNSKSNKNNIYYIRQPFEVDELCRIIRKLTEQYAI